MKKTKTINKKILKKGYYWEFSPLYDSLPEKLPIPADVKETVTTKSLTTEEEIVKDQTYFTKEEAFGLACRMIEENKIEKYKANLIWFKDDTGELCEVHVSLFGDGWNVCVFKFNPTGEWDAGRRSFFRNGPSDTSKTLSPSENLTLDSALKMVKEAGYQVSKII